MWEAFEQHQWVMPPVTSAWPLQSKVQVELKLPHESSFGCPGQGFDPVMVEVPVVMGRLIGMLPVLEPSSPPGGQLLERL